MSSKTKTTATKEDTTPALVPKLRFPEFRGADYWKPETMSGVATVVMGSSPKSEYYNESQDGLPLLQGNADIKNRLSAPRIFTSEITKECHVGDILMSVRAPVGSIAKSIHHACIGRGIAAIHAKQPNSQEFLYQWLLSYEPRWVNISQGGTFDAINSDDLKHVGLTTPSSPEQQKIAECLSSMDELMAAQSRKVDALKTHKKGLVRQLFPREGETQPRLRFPEFQNAGEWNLTTVGGLVEAGCLFAPKDGNHGNIHPKSSDYVAKGIPFIMASDLNGGLIDIENCHFISKEQADTLQKGFAKEGDVLLSHKGTVGEVAVVRKINTPYLMLTPQVTYYRVKDRKKLSNEFLAQLFVADAFQSNLVEVSGGGTRAYIGITEQAKLRLQLPKDVEEQQRTATCLSSLDALITAETQKHEALKTHKKGLMQQLFPSSEKQNTL